MMEKIASDFEISSSSSSQENGTASEHSQRDSGFVLDNQGSLGDQPSAEQNSWSHSRYVPRPILNSFERKPLLDTDNSLNCTSIGKERAALVIAEHKPGYDANSEPLVGHVFPEKVCTREARF
jgi:hypothetical protein